MTDRYLQACVNACLLSVHNKPHICTCVGFTVDLKTGSLLIEGYYDRVNIVLQFRYINNCIIPYGRWVFGISRGLHCGQQAPRQYNDLMTGNPRNPP